MNRHFYCSVLSLVEAGWFNKGIYFGPLPCPIRSYFIVSTYVTTLKGFRPLHIGVHMG